MIPEGWRTYNLSQIITLIGGGTPKTNVDEYWNGPIPWLSVVDFNSVNKHIYSSEKTITEKGLHESATNILKKGQLIISARGTVGELAMLGKDMAFNQSCYGINANEKTNNEYLFYLFKSSIQRIKKNTHGAVFDTITKQTFENIAVNIPNDISEQSRIASILSSLDDKIELNLQINKTLDAIFQAIFKEWFVDFSFPGFDGELVDGLPKGWKKVPLKEVVDTISLTYKFINDTVVFLNTSDILNGEVLNHIPISSKTLPGQAKKSIQKDDILFSEIRPANRRFAYIDFDTSNYVVSTKLMVLRSKGTIDPLVIYYYLKRDEVLNELQALAESRSGTFPQITYTELGKLNIVIPDDNTNTIYTSLLRSTFNMIRNNQVENQTLIQIRDTLLPKLMTGKIRVA